MLRRQMRVILKLAAPLVFGAASAILIFLIIEGLSSSIFVARKVVTGRPIAERFHTGFDEELGWVNMPDVYIEDMYGPGLYVKTNSQSFRNNSDFDVSVPSGKVRIICSGDSFTFGYGVDNDHTWCQLLASINKSLEPVNMGLGGYGIDQAYLWYKRDGTRLEHDIHIFAFITFDFGRMQADSLLGYGKPVLEVKHGAIVTTNVPVPRHSFYTPWLIRTLLALNELDSIRLSQELFSSENRVSSGKEDVPSDGLDQEVVRALFEDLHQANLTKDSTLVLVYLPTKEDYMGNGSDLWRQFLHDEAARSDWLFIDLVEEFRKLPPHQVEGLFIPQGVLDDPAAAGHYSGEGNAYIANILYEKLLIIPEIAGQLEQW